MDLGSTCSVIKGCQNCTFSGCIWCGEEYGCHDEFSPYGCMYSKPCNNITQCMRKHPEKILSNNYTPLNPFVIVISFINISILFIVCIYGYYIIVF